MCPIRFSVIGLNHGHIYGMVGALLAAGAELLSVYSDAPALLPAFLAMYPQCRAAASPSAILEDPTLHLIASAAINHLRSEIAIEAMRHGKDVLLDKPGFTSIEQLEAVRRVQAETKRIVSIDFSERFHSAATVRAGELVLRGAIGRVINMVALGPHRLNASSRAPWFFSKQQQGGILADLATHAFDQFLYLTGSKSATVEAAHTANLAHPEYPDFDDFGDALVRGEEATGYIRVDWFTPSGLDTWGDVRLLVTGTEGFLEVRKNCDVAGRAHGDHLFLVNHRGVEYFDCAGELCPYATQLISDIVNRTETAMTHEHCFLASRLALEAQALGDAQRISSREFPGKGLHGASVL